MITVCVMFLVLLTCLLTNAVELREDHGSQLSANKNRVPRSSDNGISCTLPSYPDNGHYTVINGAAEPGDTVEINTLLKFECDRGYKLTTGAYLVCDEKWSLSNIPQCERLCPPLTSTSKTILRCVDKRGNETSCQESTEGSYLSYTCSPFYETPFGHKKTLLCIDGTWNYPKPVCQPKCGKKINDDNSPLIYGVPVLEVIEYPWVVAVYSKTANENEYLNVCGGTIISPRVVLTAAHCVTNTYGDLYPKENYKVGGGKLYNKYYDKRDTEAQYLDIFRIIVHPGYKGENRRFQADIAVFITKGSFTLDDNVQPVCFNDVNNVHVYAGNKGVICGWGVQDDGLPSERLRALVMPYKYETTCAQELPKEWADKYAMIDKICAGFYNRSMAVCRGDSGGGLVFKNPEDNRYYVHGVVSIGPTVNGECNIQQNSLYTKVAFYYEFLDKEISKYFNDAECTLPPYPKNGKWSIEGSEKKPGDIVTSDTVIKYKCNKGFRVSNPAEIECDSSHGKPICQPECPTISFPSGTVVSCRNKKGDKINCTEAIEGATLTYTCPKGYVMPSGTKNVRTCNGESWGSPTPSCKSATAVTPTPSPTNPNTGPLPRVICSYASWHSHKGVNPENLDISLCTHLVYAFIGIWPDGRIRIQDQSLDIGNNKNGLYYKVGDLKKINKNLKVLLSVGGSAASNSSVFSDVAADSEKRATFAKTAMEVLKTYNFDGLEIEWLWPNVEDKVNYIAFLKEVKQELKKQNRLLTASVFFNPSDNGYDVPQMNKILDWVTVRTYDMYGSWSKYTGQSSALLSSSEEYEWERNHLNLEASARNWLAAGLSKSKLVVSAAFYGRSFTLQFPDQNGLHAPITGAGPGESEGFLRYSEICQKYAQWTRVWDNEQKNPYKYRGNIWFGYDDKDSVKIKAEYVKNKGYAGINVWPVDGDDVHGKCGTKQPLLKQVRLGLGYAAK